MKKITVTKICEFCEQEFRTKKLSYPNTASYCPRCVELKVWYNSNNRAKR